MNAGTVSCLCRPPENKTDLHMGPFLAAGSPNTALVQCVGYGVQAAAVPRAAASDSRGLPKTVP